MLGEGVSIFVPHPVQFPKTNKKAVQMAYHTSLKPQRLLESRFQSLGFSMRL